MKKFLLTLFVIIIVAGVIGGAGFVGYRYGFMQGASVQSNSDEVVKPFRRGDNFGWNHMPFHDGMRPYAHHQNMSPRGGFGGGFMFPLFFLVRIAFYGLVIWVAYKLFTGWRVNFTPPNKPAETEQKNN